MHSEDDCAEMYGGVGPNASKEEHRNIFPLDVGVEEFQTDSWISTAPSGWHALLLGQTCFRHCRGTFHEVLLARSAT